MSPSGYLISFQKGDGMHIIFFKFLVYISNMNRSTVGRRELLPYIPLMKNVEK